MEENYSPPPTVGALRSRLSGIKIFSFSAPLQEPTIPAQEAELTEVYSPQPELEEEEETVLAERYGATEWDI